MYGPDGEWAQFFRPGRGYIGTELLRDIELPSRYLVIDRWESAEAYNAFAAEHREQYMRRVDDTRFYLRPGAALRYVRERVAGERLIPPHHDPGVLGLRRRAGRIRLPQPTAEKLTEYEAWFQFDERHQGGPGFVHGGLVAAALDEALRPARRVVPVPGRHRADLRPLPATGGDQHGAPRARVAPERARPPPAHRRAS